MIKSWVITIILGFGLTVLVMFFYEKFGDPGILLICAAAIGLSLILNLISVPLMRVFNKFEPLEDGTLKEALLDLCTRYGVKVKKIVVRDASRRTTRANAFCTGLTKRKTISLDEYEADRFAAREGYGEGRLHELHIPTFLAMRSRKPLA